MKATEIISTKLSPFALHMLIESGEYLVRVEGVAVCVWECVHVEGSQRYGDIEMSSCPAETSACGCAFGSWRMCEDT